MEQPDGGIQVTAQPFFLAEKSDPSENEYVFAYRMRIENHGHEAAQLLWRHWYIHDPVGGDSEVEGEGVVGEQPVIEPGGAHEYQSFCVLAGPQGWMEGYYQFARPDGRTFNAPILPFSLRTHDA